MSTPDVQGGPKRMREDSTLNHFTGNCGPSIFRGNSLPEDLKGDLLICEPVGRLIRRAEVMNKEGKIVLKNTYQQKEFIASTDMNFRPVHSATGPDGCLYIVDMYRGIIQESNWTREGSYLREVAVRKTLDKNIGRGRIYRLVHEDYQPGPLPSLLDDPTDKLVDYLYHPNGWWRDNAQKLIILRNDQSVVPALNKIATYQPSVLDKVFFWKTYPDEITRIHALWTLEGMGAMEEDILFQALEDQASEVRKTAIWISDAYLKKGDSAILNKLLTMQDDPSPDVRIQLVLSLRFGKTTESKVAIEEMMKKYADNDMLVTAGQKSLLEGNEEILRLMKKIASKNTRQKKAILKGYHIFKQICAACHGNDGKGILVGNQEMPAPPLAGSPRMYGNTENLIKIVLQGMTGPVDGKEYPDVMPPMGQNDDEYIAAVLTYVLTEIGNRNSEVRPEQVGQIRKETEGRKGYWTLNEL